MRDAPDDAKLRSRLARVYLQLGDPVSAEREARAAREHNGAEADYLPVLDQALLRQGKFTDLADLVQPGNRPAALESQVRWALGMAAAGLRDNAKAQTLMQDAIRLDPNAAAPKIAMARLLAVEQTGRREQAARRRAVCRSALGRGTASEGGTGALPRGYAGRDERFRRGSQDRPKECRGAA